LEAEDDMVAVEPVPALITGAAPQKLPRRQSILNSLKKGLRRNHDLPEVRAISIPDKQEGGPPLLRRRSSNPELRPKVSRRAIASLPRQQTLKRSESAGWRCAEARMERGWAQEAKVTETRTYTFSFCTGGSITRIK
jgi:hypothetical protein